MYAQCMLHYLSKVRVLIFSVQCFRGWAKNELDSLNLSTTALKLSEALFILLLFFEF